MVNVTFYASENRVNIETPDCTYDFDDTNTYDIDVNGVVSIIDDNDIVRAKFPFVNCILVFED